MTMTKLATLKFHPDAGIPGDTFEIDGHLWVCEADPRSKKYPETYPALHWVSPSCMHTVSVAAIWKQGAYGASCASMSYRTKERAALAARVQHEIDLAAAQAIVDQWGE